MTMTKDRTCLKTVITYKDGKAVSSVSYFCARNLQRSSHAIEGSSIFVVVMDTATYTITSYLITLILLFIDGFIDNVYPFSISIIFAFSAQNIYSQSEKA